MAAAVLQRALRGVGRHDLIVESAGTGAWEGAPVSEGAYLVGLEQGLDLSRHRARVVTPELVEAADLILTMSRTHLARVRELGGGGRAHLIGEYAGLAGSAAEVVDPFGGDLDEYRAALRSILAMAPALVDRIAGRAAP